MPAPEPLFPESPEEKAEREAFYEVGGEDRRADLRSLSVKASGAIVAVRPLKRREKVTITIADENGEVVARGEGQVTGVGFDEDEKNGLVIVERKHKVKLD